MVNFANLSTPTKGVLFGSGPSWSGVEGNINDANNGTSIGLTITPVIGFGGFYYGGMSGILTFQTPRPIQQIEIRFQYNSGLLGWWSLQGYYDSSLNTLESSGGGGTGIQDISKSASGRPWENKDILYVQFLCWAKQGTASPNFVGSIFEIRTLGSPYADSKLKFKTTSGTKKIGMYPNATTSPLRIQTYKGFIYIPLVSTGDSEASALRIRKGGVTYALAEYK